MSSGILEKPERAITKTMAAPLSIFEEMDRLADDFKAAVLRLPAIKRLLADAVLPAQLPRLEPRLGIFQHTHNLLFRVPALLHPFSSSASKLLASIMGELSPFLD